MRLGEVAEPAPRGGGVVITVLAAHVPAYTAMVAEGSRGAVPAPLVLGPGCVGRVEAVADDVFGVDPGDIVLDVALLGTGDVDGPQEVLVGWTGIGGRGRPTEKTTAMRSVWRNGVFAERALCAKETLVRLPGAEDYPDTARLAFVGWLAIAAEGLNRAGQRAGQTVVVLGATGQLGAAALLVALANGAARVVAVGRDEATLARLAGLDRRVVPVRLTGDRAADAAAMVGAGGEADVVLDALGAVPSAAPTLAGYDALRPGGTLVLIGGVRQDLALPYGDVMRRRLTIRGSWMSPPATALAMWRLVQSGAVDLGVLDVRPVGLDDPSGALDLAAAASGLEIVALVP